MLRCGISTQPMTPWLKAAVPRRRVPTRDIRSTPASRPAAGNQRVSRVPRRRDLPWLNCETESALEGLYRCPYGIRLGDPRGSRWRPTSVGENSSPLFGPHRRHGLGLRAHKAKPAGSVCSWLPTCQTTCRFSSKRLANWGGSRAGMFTSTIESQMPIPRVCAAAGDLITRRPTSFALPPELCGGSYADLNASYRIHADHRPR